MRRPHTSAYVSIRQHTSAYVSLLLKMSSGCAVVGPGGEALYSWVDGGLCDTPDINDVIDFI
jgi:hypothetical protein